MNNSKISAIVTTYNEDKRLSECLSRLSFCDELIVVDLGSRDNSIKIAKKYATKVINYKRVFQVEQILSKFAPILKNKWILHIDPDEILDERLIDEMIRGIINNPNAAIICVPIHYYFKGKKLNHTIWGGDKKFRKILINKNRVIFKSRVHRGIELLDKKYKIIRLKSKHSIKHFWIDSYKQLFQKHKRYIKLEGQSRYDNGMRYSFRQKISESIKSLMRCLIKEKGIFGGFNEIFLSIFYGWYIWQANNSLKKYEKTK